MRCFVCCTTACSGTWASPPYRTASGPASGTGRPRRPTHPREVIEAALARSDLFERRRLLMDEWAAYVGGQADDSARR